MSSKFHFLHSYLDFSYENMGAVSHEHDERFHQDISQMGKKYSGKWNSNIFADSCLVLIRATPTGEYKRQKKKKWVLINFFVVRILYMETLFII